MYKKIKKKLKNKFLGRAITLSAEECRNMRFFQYNVGTVEYFRAKSYSFDIRISDLPHFSFSRGLHEKRGDGEQCYREYLSASWGSGDYERKIEGFRQHYRFFLDNGPAHEPIITSLPGVAGFLVVDGNHRVSMASATGTQLNARYVPYRKVLLNFSCLGRFFKGSSLREVVQLAENSANPVWSGGFKRFFDFLSFAKIHRRSTLDATGIPCLLEALHFRYGLKGGLSILSDQRLASFALRTLVLRGLYPSFNAICVSDNNFGVIFDFVICLEENLDQVLSGYGQRLAVNTLLVIISRGRALKSLNGVRFMVSQDLGGSRWGAVFELSGTGGDYKEVAAK